MFPLHFLDKKFQVIVNAPENVAHSNGISVLLAAARLLRSQGLSVEIVPSDSIQPRSLSLPPPFDDLPISWTVAAGCFALIGDTIGPLRLQEVRERASKICYYTLAPNGLFRGEGTFPNKVLIRPGERQAVYSPQISTVLPFFYYQSYFNELQPWIDSALANPRSAGRSLQAGQLRASIYAGKGFLQPVPHGLRKLINRSKSRLITRFSPSSKQELYSLLAETDCLICFDPLTSLAHEAILMGIPVYIPLEWDEKDFHSLFPVRLDGIVFNDLDQFLHVLSHGYDHLQVVNSYYSALERNSRSLEDLFAYAFSDSQHLESSDRLNAYWGFRSEFFASLNLPSPPSAWRPIEAALPASNLSEYLKELIIRVCIRLYAFKQRLAAPRARVAFLMRLVLRGFL